MSKLIENIKRLARMVKNETKSGGNTAMRVGGLLEEIGEELENKYDRTETDLLLSGHDTADSSHRNIQDRFDREMDGLDLSLTEKINQADQKQTAAIAATNETLAAHSGNQATHKTSQQIRGEIVDADIPASLARVADVESRDAAVLQTARQHTDSSVSALGNDVYRKTETYTRTETDDRDTAVLQASRQHTDISVSALGNDVYRKAETYTRAETDSRDAAVLRDSKEYVVSKIAEIVDGSPAALNTLCEIANAINNDPNFATSIMTVINGKADTVHSHAKTQITDFPLSMPASDVYSWAKELHKPTYFPGEVGAASEDHNHNETYASLAHVHSSTDVKEAPDRRFMTDAERSKLAGVEPAANNYTHPVSHPASMITEQADKRFMTDAERIKLIGIETTLTSVEKEAWNGKFSSYCGDIPKNVNVAENLNDYLSPGVYTYAAANGTVINRPNGDFGYGVLLVLKAKDFVAQIIFENDTVSSMYIRTYYWKFGFQNWRKI